MVVSMNSKEFNLNDHSMDIWQVQWLLDYGNLN